MIFETSQPPRQSSGAKAAKARLPPFPDTVRTAAISTISLRRLRDGDLAESRRLFKACCEYGFFHLDLGGDDSDKGGESESSLLDILSEVFAINAELHDLPDATKQPLAYGPPKQLFGHKAVGRNKVEDGSPDRYEAWTFARDDILDVPALKANNDSEAKLLPPLRPPLPELALEHQGVLAAYVRAAHSIVELVCSHLGKHLTLPQGTLEGLQRLDLPSQTSVRLLRYLPHDTTVSSLQTKTKKSLVGHTDIGTVTILAENGVGGLQVLPPGAKTGDDANWEYVRPKPGCVIVNLGDAMPEWSGGILRSDLHRVVAAPGEQAAATRYSIAYLVRPESHAKMEPLKEEWRRDWDGNGDDHGKSDRARKVWTALEWEVRKSQSIISGSDVAHSKGGVPIERWAK